MKTAVAETLTPTYVDESSPSVPEKLDFSGNEVVTFGLTFEEAKSQIDENIWVLKRSEVSGENYKVTWARRQN